MGYNQKMFGLGSKRSIIREIFEYSKARAAEIGADAILLAKNVDGVYSADPAKDPSAVKYDTITYDQVLAQHLAVMDTTATSLSMDNHLPIVLFALKDPENIYRVVMGEEIGTIVKEEKQNG